MATRRRVGVYGLTAGGGLHPVVRVAGAHVRGVRGLAAGPVSAGSTILAATAQTVKILAPLGSALREVPGGVGGLTNNLGVASDADGKVMATWSGRSVRLWAWDGARYVAAPSWDPTTAASGRVVGVAMAPRTRMYWVLTTRRALNAYAYGSSGVVALSGLSGTVPPGRFAPRAIDIGWNGTGVVIAGPDGWRYAEAKAGGMQWERLLGWTGAKWSAYRARSVVESRSLVVGHHVTQLRVEDATCITPGVCQDGVRLPLGTAVAYQFATGDCTTWKAAPIAVNFTLSAVASAVCYRLVLSTADPRRTPLVRVTNIYEIASQSSQSRVAALLCVLGACGG